VETEQTVASTEAASLDGELENIFTYHSPTPEMIPKFALIREKAKELAYLIKRTVPESKEQTIATNMVESAVMWANAGIARRTVTMGKVEST
jgi:hypothetical protein